MQYIQISCKIQKDGLSDTYPKNAMKFPNNILESIKNKLERDKQSAQKNLSKIKEEDPFADPARLSDNASLDTEAKEEIGHDRVEAIKGALSSQLSRIEIALKRLKRGEYGICERCGKAIETKRLEIMPTATLCVACERKKEGHK